MRYRSYLKWINLGAVLLIIAACKKDLPYGMKTGYYAVQDIRVYTNGSRDTLYYTAVGPIVRKLDFEFRSNKGGNLIIDQINIPPAGSELRGDGGIGNVWSFNNISFEWTETSIYCYRESPYSPSTAGVFNNYITYKFVE